MNLGRSSKEAFCIAATHLAAVWCVFALVELGLFLSLHGTVWGWDQLPRGAAVGLVCADMVAIAVPAAVIGVPLTMLAQLTSMRRPSSLSLAALLFPAAWIGLLLYTASWALFRSTGRFLGPVAMEMWLASPVQLVQHAVHMEPRTVALIPTLATASTLGLWVLLRRGLSPGLRTRRILIAGVAGLGMVVCLTAARTGQEQFGNSRRHLWDPATGIAYTTMDLYAKLRDNSTGVGLYIAGRFLRGFSSGARLSRALDHADIRWRPLMPMAQYVEAVDPARRKQWNVITIVVESLRADILQATGASQVIMPHLEQLARESLVFTNHYTTSTQSNYACVVPLSGHYPLRSATFYIYEAAPAYPRVFVYDILKAVGYRTGFFSSQNESWGGMRNYLRTGGIDHFLDAETYDGPTYVPTNDIGFARFVTSTKRSGKIDDRFTVAEAIAWIDSLDRGPFFMHMNLQNSHVPYDIPSDFPPRFGSGQVSFPLRFNSFPPDSAGAVKQLYANSLAYVDHQLGRLFAHLEARGLWDNTVVVVTGDHGQAFYEHGFAAHANAPYEELARTPLIIRAPNLDPGMDARPAQHVDIPPTILSILGLPPHPSFQGIDLLRPTYADDRPLYTIVQSPMAHQYAVVRGDRKLIYDAWSDRYILYDLRADPAERKDISSARPAVADSLARQLDTWRKAQLEYYRTPALHTRWYPPVLPDR